MLLIALRAFSKQIMTKCQFAFLDGAKALARSSRLAGMNS